MFNSTPGSGTINNPEPHKRYRVACDKTKTEIRKNEDVGLFSKYLNIEEGRNMPGVGWYHLPHTPSTFIFVKSFVLQNFCCY